ncbi:hypothetical protein EDB87DRAFT_1598085, partial [Lactarius vividus]
MHRLLHTQDLSTYTSRAAQPCGTRHVFAGMRRVLSELLEQFSEEITRFETYDEKLGVLGESRKDWNEVTLARGRGRPVRE